MVNPIKFIAFGRRFDSVGHILRLYEKKMLEGMEMSKLDAKTWIRENVPKRTGQLQDSLISCIDTDWNFSGVRYNADIVTNVPYAYKIMGDPAHFGTYYEHSGKPAVANYYGHHGRIFLNDPAATTFWDSKMTDYMKDNITTNLSIAIGYKYLKYMVEDVG